MAEYGWDQTPTPDLGLDITRAPEDIQKLYKWVIEKTYGEDVASAYAQGLAAAGIIAKNAEAMSLFTSGQVDTLEQFVRDTLIELTDRDVISAPEIIDSRDGEATLSDRLNRDHEQLVKKATILQYSQLKSITRLIDALMVEGTSVDIDEDITLNEPLTLHKSGIWSSNKSTISLGDDGQIIAKGRFHVRDLDIVNISDTSTKPMVYLNRDGGSHFNGSSFRGINMEGTNLKRNGIEMISEKESCGIYGATFEDVNFARMNDEIHIEVNETGGDYGWVNGNLFTDIRGGGSYRGIVSLPIDKFAVNRNVSNIFNNMQLQTYRTSAVYDLGLNIYDIQPYDFHRTGHVDITLNKFGKINGEIHSLAQNTVAIFNPKHSAFTGSQYLEIGMFTDLSTPNSFANIHFYTHKGVYKGKIILSLLNEHITNNQFPVNIQYENVELENLLILTHFESTNGGIRVFIKSFGDIAYWGVYERKFFMPTYSPFRFTPEEMDTIPTQLPSKISGGFEYSTEIYESVIEGGQNITRYHDGRMVIFSDVVETITIPTIQPSNMSGNNDILAEFKRRFISKPVVTFNGQPSKSGSPLTNLPITNRTTALNYATGVIINKYSEPIDKIIDFSWTAVGRWK